MKISIIHPSRGRAAIAKQVYDNWMGKADKPENIEYIVSMDWTDNSWANYVDLFFGEGQSKYIPQPGRQILFDNNVSMFIDHNNTAIEAINNVAKEATGDLLIVVSDDFDCPEHWDTELLKYLKGKSDFVVKTYDGLQPWIITLPIMDRVYYERFGYVYNPGYKHMFCDTEMTAVGDLLGKTILVPMLFQHKHYSQPGGIKKDAVSVKNDNTWGQGERLYIDRIKRNFDLPESEVKGVLRCDAGHTNWLASKGVKLEFV